VSVLIVALSVTHRSAAAEGAASRFPRPECEAFRWMPEQLDYRAPAAQLRIQQIESNHFDRETELLIRGKTGSIGADIDFLLRYIPNHPRGLVALVRLALRENNPKPAGVSIPVECHLLRALAFVPNDPAVLAIYGSFLLRINRIADAYARLKEAEQLDPNNATLLYNLGLAAVGVGDLSAARSYAERAYAGGIELPGLRDHLRKAGQWKD
jgi:tetratricopeptide (TPR) repeat protein